MRTSASHSASTARCLGCTTVCLFAMAPPASGAMASSSRSRSSKSSACLLQAISSALPMLGSATALFTRAASAIAAQAGHLRLTAAAQACTPSSRSQGAAHRARPRSRKASPAAEGEEEGVPTNERMSMMQSLGRSAKVVVRARAGTACNVEGLGLIGGVSGAGGARARLGESIVVVIAWWEKGREGESVGAKSEEKKLSRKKEGKKEKFGKKKKSDALSLSRSSLSPSPPSYSFYD